MRLSLAVLAGGSSDRMGQDKALKPFLGQPLIQRVLERLAPLADEILIATDQPGNSAFLGYPLIPDLFPGRGALGGLYTVLDAAKHPLVAVVACDMPFASFPLFAYERELCSQGDADVVIPATPKGLEPLHAVYRRASCLPVVRAAIEAGDWKLIGWLPKVKVHPLSHDEIIKYDPRHLAFWNLNTLDEFVQAEQQARLEDSL